MRTRLRHALAAVPLALAVLISVSACAPTQEILVTPDTTIVDVRTPAEYAEGHLEGAVNIDVTASDFDARLSELDPEADYVVYCRSGNRSAQAVSRMTGAGFASVTDAGALSAASTSTGLPIVTD
ncbi:rhodanese-like domain-containing protein [Microbacterium hominis]|uniref:Rhodanese-like domain-containing protein n=1 Tax=Microbacterium hominis TaxID=162426 RepID=A0A7D4UB29_9MICO|nr:rhodanese-like domain-containing protein [Microbacterium hominis]QKJ19083.1 rhodanese-like domain-containing protein [Microbacterium hominis]